MLVLMALVPCTADALAPTCFSDPNAYMVATYGAEFKDDDNLRVTERMFGKIRFTLVEDRTSGTNHSRVLLRASSDEQMCVVLETPPVAQLDVVKVNAAGVPEEFNAAEQAPPGMPGTEICYRLASDTTYRAVTCTAVKWQGKKVIRTPISCAAP
jgi:hypothetical protein